MLGLRAGMVPFLVGIGLCVLAVLEVTLREHLTGYRTHWLILGVLAVVPFQLVLYFATDGFWQGIVAGIGDAVVLVVACLLLRRQFDRASARRARARA